VKRTWFSSNFSIETWGIPISAWMICMADERKDVKRNKMEKSP
jgi:hypothetical protein